jgi:antitoxin VapB
MSEAKRAKVFWSGRSQAVRLPKEFRFDANEVSIRREGSAVILEPLEKPGWPEGFWAEFDKLPPLPDDFELPERLPPSSEPTYRDKVIEEWIESMPRDS